MNNARDVSARDIKIGDIIIASRGNAEVVFIKTTTKTVTLTSVYITGDATGEGFRTLVRDSWPRPITRIS